MSLLSHSKQAVRVRDLQTMAGSGKDRPLGRVNKVQIIHFGQIFIQDKFGQNYNIKSNDNSDYNNIQDIVKFYQGTLRKLS